MSGGPPESPARFEQVVVCSGHMIDAPDRRTPRFPPNHAEAVREQIARQLTAWNVNDRALAIWDEKPSGDGPGGTSDFEKRIRSSGGEVKIINPTLWEQIP